MGNDVTAALNIDLNAKYRYWNDKAFDGLLPIIPVVWMKSKRIGGSVHGTYNRMTGVTISTKMDISEYLVTDEEKLDAVMLHEMVHVKMSVEFTGKDYGGQHGVFFQKYKREAEQKAGHDIAVSEDLSGWELSEDVEAKDYGVFLINRPNGKTSMKVFNLNAFMRDLPLMKEWIAAFDYAKEYTAVWIVSKDRILLRYKIKNKFKKWDNDWYPATDIQEKLIKDGKVICKYENNDLKKVAKELLHIANLI